MRLRRASTPSGAETARPTAQPFWVATSAPALDQFYTHSTYTTLWDSNDSVGMVDMIATMTADASRRSAFRTYTSGAGPRVYSQSPCSIRLWRTATSPGPASVRPPPRSQVDFQGLAPDQNWTGDPNDFIVRETYMYDVDLSAFNQVSMADYAALDDKSTAGTGSSLIGGLRTVRFGTGCSVRIHRAVLRFSGVLM